MRLDHIAYRTKDRHKTADFFREAFGYEAGTEFQIEFDDGSKADCIALTPPEDRHRLPSYWTHHALMYNPPDGASNTRKSTVHAEFHAPPEIFVSDGSEGSIVGDWVAERGGVGGIHHIAYQVEDVEAVMKEWKDKGYAEFYSEAPISCKDPDLVQVFTKPSELTGVIYEFINREGAGFCKDSVKQLMESTKG
jgi:catechol 2,3-dioxygenase-like lactoylglutathione lyase family enzyme